MIAPFEQWCDRCEVGERGTRVLRCWVCGHFMRRQAWETAMRLAQNYPVTHARVRQTTYALQETS